MPWVPGAVGTDCLSKGKTIYALAYDHTTVQRSFDYLEFFRPIKDRSKNILHFKAGCPLFKELACMGTYGTGVWGGIGSSL